MPSAARNTGPTVHGGNQAPDAPYEHQEYPTTLFKYEDDGETLKTDKAGNVLTKVVADPDEHARALGKGWSDPNEEVQEPEEVSDEDAEEAPSAPVAAKSSRKSKK